MPAPAIVQNRNQRKHCDAHGREHSSYDGDIVCSEVIRQAESGVYSESDKNDKEWYEYQGQDEDSRTANFGRINIVGLGPCGDD